MILMEQNQIFLKHKTKISFRLLISTLINSYLCGPGRQFPFSEVLRVVSDFILFPAPQPTGSHSLRPATRIPLAELKLLTSSAPESIGRSPSTCMCICIYNIFIYVIFYSNVIHNTDCLT